MGKDVVIVSAKRSPFGKYLGVMSRFDPVDLAARVAAAALAIPGTSGGTLAGYINQAFVGNCIAAEFPSASVVGRQVTLRLGLPCFTTTIDTACCSSLTALRLATAAIANGEIEGALIVGVEMMSRVPHYARNLRRGVRVGGVALEDPIFPLEYVGYEPVAIDAARGAEKHGVTRRDMDQWALRSHQKWLEAFEAGKFADEVIPLDAPQDKGSLRVDRDEPPRPNVKLAEIERLPPVFGSASITAGNAPGLNDGAAALVVMAAERARELGFAPLGTILAQAFATTEPAGLPWVPAVAIQHLLGRTGRSLDQIDRIEINEAFAAVPLVSTKILADHDQARWQSLLAKTNVNGGAVALGHPVGASGLRLAITLSYELGRLGGGLGIAAICGGLAQGEAVLIRA